jgi:leader peptidase (prepilin peptidase)/N-methyltransferase
MNDFGWIALATAAGWVWGSFLNLLVDRTPLAGRPFVATPLRPARSICLSCGVQLGWRDLVPVASYLLLRGRCGTCGAAIGRRTLAVECLTPLLFGACAFGLARIERRAGWGALAGFGFATLSWLLVAVPLLIEGRRPRPRFLAVGAGLLAALAVTALALALDVLAVKA